RRGTRRLRRRHRDARRLLHGDPRAPRARPGHRRAGAALGSRVHRDERTLPDAVTAPTPEVFIVGAGPVATALGGALRHAGVPVLGLWGRRSDAVRIAAGIAGIAGFSAAPPDLLLEANAVVFAVRDDAIPQVARTVVDAGLLGKRHVLLHCSGARSAAEA